MELEPGSHFAGYEVVSKLGQGGMGAVFRVENPDLERIEALKIISTGVGNTEFVKRFVNEARLAANLEHPGIVTVYRAGVEQGLPWYTMEYLESIDLSRTGGLDILEVAEVVTKSAEAIDYANHRGVIHRDIKPANIALTRDAGTGRIQRVVVMDFGLAKALGGEQLTAQRTFMATLNYAAPETVHGAPASAYSDQYSLACTAFELLSGRPPYVAANATELVAAHWQAPVTPLGSLMPQLAPLDPSLIRAMAKDPALRYPTCRAFAADFTAAAQMVPAGYRTVALAPPLSEPIVAPAQHPEPAPETDGEAAPDDLAEAVTTAQEVADHITGEIPMFGPQLRALPSPQPQRQLQTPEPQTPQPPMPRLQQAPRPPQPSPMAPSQPPASGLDDTTSALAVLVGVVIGLLVVLVFVLLLTLG